MYDRAQYGARHGVAAQTALRQMRLPVMPLTPQQPSGGASSAAVDPARLQLAQAAAPTAKCNFCGSVFKQSAMKEGGKEGGEGERGRGR